MRPGWLIRIGLRMFNDRADKAGCSLITMKHLLPHLHRVHRAWVRPARDRLSCKGHAHAVDLVKVHWTAWSGSRHATGSCAGDHRLAHATYIYQDLVGPPSIPYNTAHCAEAEMHSPMPPRQCSTCWPHTAFHTKRTCSSVLATCFASSCRYNIGAGTS